MRGGNSQGQAIAAPAQTLACLGECDLQPRGLPGSAEASHAVILGEAARHPRKCPAPAVLPVTVCCSNVLTCSAAAPSSPHPFAFSALSDIQSVQNTRIRHQFPSEGITHLFGIPVEEVQVVMNAASGPDGTGTFVDVKRWRPVLGTASSRGEPMPRSKPSITDLFALPPTGSNAESSPAIVTFSRPPPQIPSPSGNTFNDDDAIISPGAHIPSLTTRVFQANSIVVSHYVLAQLQVWQGLLGWESRPANEGSIPPASVEPVARDREKDGEEGEGDKGVGSSRTKANKADSSHTVFVAAPPSEIEYYDIARPKDLSVLALAHEVFIIPAITAQQGEGDSPTGVLSSHSPSTFSPLNLGSSSESTSSSQPPSSSERRMHVPYDFSALDLGSSPDSMSSSRPPSFSGLGIPPTAGPPLPSISPRPGVSPLITPQTVLQYLPTKAWRAAFMREFDTLMVNHDGIGVSGDHSIFKERIELMFEWADGNMKKTGSNDAESGSNFSSSSVLGTCGRRGGSIQGWGGRRGNSRKEVPPPTTSLFAVASAAYALGALSYASRSIYGEFPEGEAGKNYRQRRESAAGSPPTATCAPGESAPKPQPSFAPGLGGQQNLPTNPPPLSLNSGWPTFALTSFRLLQAQLPQKGEPVTSTLSPHTHPLCDKATPGKLLNLSRAALLVHDESGLPPSLDYLLAHMLTWLYLLHPSDCASSLTSCGIEGASAGVGSGGMTVVEETIYKELGKCVSVARRMGLDLVDRPSGQSKGGSFVFGKVEKAEEENKGMGIWEKEMRRRVWWRLMMFDQQISENLGRLPLIPPGTYTCKPPSAVNESVFDPTATTIPRSQVPGCHNTKHFATKCQLLTIIKTLSYAQLEEGVSLKLARQLDARLSNWRSTLPARYKIDFREKPEETSFPHADTVDVQACDLHIMANVFLLRLWLPFFNEALSNSSQESQGVLLTAATAANAVIAASYHLVRRFRAVRPMSFGHYDFGSSVWLATGILASIAMKSQVIFRSTAIRGVEIAGELFRNQVLKGKLNSIYGPRYEVNNIIDHITRLVEEASKSEQSTGSKRKSHGDVGQIKMRYGAPIPYVGLAAINLPKAHGALRRKSTVGWWKTSRYQNSDEASSASPPPMRRRRTTRNQDRETTSDSEPFHPSDVRHGPQGLKKRLIPITSTSGVDLASNLRPSRAITLASSVSPVGETSSSDSPHSHPSPLSPRRAKRNLEPGPPSHFERFHPTGVRRMLPQSTGTEAPGSRASSLADQSCMSTSQPSSSQNNKSHSSITLRRRRLLVFNEQAPPTWSTSRVDLPSGSKRSHARANMPPASESSIPNTPHTHPYSLSSSQPDAPVMTAPRDQPSPSQRPPIHQVSVPDQAFHQDRPSQSVQHQHDSSPSITIGNYHPVQEFSQPPQSNVLPSNYQHMMIPRQQPPASVLNPHYTQFQSPPSGTIIAADSRSQMPPSQTYDSPASAFAQTALPVARLQTGGSLINLHPTGEPPALHQPESYSPPAGVSHMDSWDSLEAFDLGFHSMSANHPQVIDEAPQYAGSPQAHQQYLFGSITHSSRTNVPAPQSQGMQTYQSRSTTGPGWLHPDPSIQYMDDAYHP